MDEATGSEGTGNPEGSQESAPAAQRAPHKRMRQALHLMTAAHHIG